MKKSSQGMEQRTGGRGILIGGAGSDVYVYNLGDGADVIRDQVEHQSSSSSWLPVYDTNVLRFGAGITPDMLVPSFDTTTRALVFDLGPSTGSGQARDRIEIGTVDNPAILQMQFAVLFGRTKFEAANDTEGRMAA